MVTDHHSAVMRPLLKYRVWFWPPQYKISHEHTEENPMEGHQVYSGLGQRMYEKWRDLRLKSNEEKATGGSYGCLRLPTERG